MGGTSGGTIRRMKKTTVYFTDEELYRLARIAAEENRSQAAVVRDAVTEYVSRKEPERRFESFGAGDSSAGSPRADDEDLDAAISTMIVGSHVEERA